ncbi:MAG TPA: WbuC family cupin fold metalloprotein [Blastocatellia bacterium]|nr:WbuC family cupin fold metalloprotein [Blastocatellia bacterium]
MEQRPVQTIDSALLDDLLQRARRSSRRRAILCLHDGDWEHAHRMLNALTVGTYVRPHRHEDIYKGEGFILLRGKIALLIFTDPGEIDFERSRLLSTDAGCLGMDIPPGFWHSLVALEDTVIYEVKGQPAGGYVQAQDKDFAPWSPEEGSREAEEYCGFLYEAALALQRSERGHVGDEFIRQVTNNSL